MIVLKSHGIKQEKAIFSNKRILLLGTGTQWGKTTVGAVRMKKAMHTHTSADDNFLITAPTYKILHQSTLPAFKKLMDGYGDFNEQQARFKMHRGGTCFFRTMTEPDSVVGITNVKHIWCDEAGKYSLYFWENIQARADFCGCPIDLTTSPYSLNWIYKDLIKPTLAGKRQDVDYITAASWENPYHSLHKQDARDAKKLTMDERRFNMLYGGIWDKMSGLVYDCWEDELNYVEPFELPQGTVYYAGVDWGFTDPFVLKVRAITPDGRQYGVSEFYKTRLTIKDQVDVARQKKQVYNIKTFFCGPDQPGSIEEFNRNGLTAVAADNDIRKGIDVHYELIKSRRYKEFAGACPYTADEREQYHYPEPEDLGPDDNAKEPLPVGQSDHCLDSDRYLSIMTYKRGEILEPKRDKKPLSRLEKLIKKPGSQHTESWS